MATQSTSFKGPVRRLSVARLISITGGGAAYLALNFTIYKRTGSAIWVAAALFLTFGMEGIIGGLAGALGDRFDRRRVMIASDLAGAACFLAMALVHAPWLLLVFAFFSAVAEAPFFSASSAAIPNLVDDEHLGWANGMVAIGRNSGLLVGPLIGGVLVSTIGSGWVFALNAVSFVVSAALVATVQGRFNQDRHGGGEEHRGLRAGFRFLWKDPVLRTITLSFLAVVIGLGMTMVADVPLVALFRAGSFGYGALIACWAGGSIVGSVLGRYIKARLEPPALVLGLGLICATSVAVGFSPWFSFALGAIFVMGIGDGVTLVAEQGMLQRRTADAVRSRVSGAYDACMHGGIALSYIAAGPAVSWLGAKGVYILGGGIAFIGVAVSLPILRAARAVLTEIEKVPDAGEADPARLLVP
jgi:MFS family permease